MIRFEIIKRMSSFCWVSLGLLEVVRNGEQQRIGLVQRLEGLVHVVVLPVLLRRFRQFQRRIQEGLIVIRAGLVLVRRFRR